MKIHRDPKATIKVVSKCERTQPYAATHLDEKGELVWEARTMPRWQMEMFKRVIGWTALLENWFMMQWHELTKYESDKRETDDREFSDDAITALPLSVIGKSKEAIEDRKRQYHKSKKWRAVRGD